MQTSWHRQMDIGAILADDYTLILYFVGRKSCPLLKKYSTI